MKEKKNLWRIIQIFINEMIGFRWRIKSKQTSECRWKWRRPCPVHCRSWVSSWIVWSIGSLTPSVICCTIQWSWGTVGVCRGWVSWHVRLCIVYILIETWGKCRWATSGWSPCRIWISSQWPVGHWVIVRSRRIAVGEWDLRVSRVPVSAWHSAVWSIWIWWKIWISGTRPVAVGTIRPIYISTIGSVPISAVKSASIVMIDLLCLIICLTILPCLIILLVMIRILRGIIYFWSWFSILSNKMSNLHDVRSL